MLRTLNLTPNTPEWYAHRKNGIGCSDVSRITGSSTYSHIIYLFYEKIGDRDVDTGDNELTLWGNQMEPIILDNWRYWDGKEKYIENKINKTPVREFEPNNDEVLYNTDFDYIFYTPDGKLIPGQKDINGNIINVKCPLEAKNINSLMFNRYNNKLPVYYEEQLNTEMMVMGVDYAEIAYLVGGNDFRVEARSLDVTMADKILECTYKFWYGKVLPAKEYLKEFHKSTKEKIRRELRGKIEALEPTPDDTEEYANFIIERFKVADKQAMATPEMEQLMQAYEFYKQISKMVDAEKRFISNTILRYHEKHNLNLLQGTDCKSTFNKRLNINGPSIPEQYIKQQINNLSIYVSKR